MIYTGKELNTKLNHLTLVGQNEDGDLEFVGTSAEFQRSEEEADEEDYEPTGFSNNDGEPQPVF